jgi:hypothetical protein
MRIRELMENNKDTAAWGGVAAILGLVFYSTELERQFLVIVVFPMLGWLAVYLLKTIVTYVEGVVTDWWKNRKTKITTSNKKELNESESVIRRIVGFVRGRLSGGSGTEV